MRVIAKDLLLVLAVASVGLSGCGWLHRSPDQSSGRIVGSALGGDPSATPFRLDVLKESNDGKSLTIQGQLVSKTERPTKDVLVRLAAMDKKGEERVALHKVADLIPNEAELKPSMPLPFSLSLPAEGITNYQVEVLWGKDAAPYLGDGRASLKQPKAPSEFLALRNLEVHRVPDGSCSSPEECRVTVSIKGEFFNSGRATVRDVVLVAGFAPASKMGLPNQPLENEKKIEVQNLELAPQGTKPFRLTLEKHLPASDTGAYQPVVRIVSFESDW